MNTKLHTKYRCRLAKVPLFLAGFSFISTPLFAQEAEEEEVFDLSPFTVDSTQDSGYYASQVLSGGRLSTDIINTGSSIEVITMDYLDDLGANNLEDLLLYTTSTEVAGISGNYTALFNNVGSGEIDTQAAQRNPFEANRVRGIARPDKARDFFVTDIPFDSYNTERLEINRGTNSFLFGLGSPGGLINTQLAKAHFNDRSRVRVRIGSGGDNPSLRGNFDFNREVIEDRLAIRVTGLMEREEYRQRPAYRDDDRIYATVTLHPFDHKRTTIRSHYEAGSITGNQPSTVLPTESFDLWLKYRQPIDVYGNMRLFRDEFGPDDDAVEDGYYTDSQLSRIVGPWDSYATVRKTPDGYEHVGGDPYNVMTNYGASSYVIVWDDNPDPSFVMLPQSQGANQFFVRGDGDWEQNQDGTWTWITEEPGDPFWSPDGRTDGGMQMQAYVNLRDGPDRGAGWYRQGFTNLENFDFTKNQLSGNNDLFDIDFHNYNVTFEQLSQDGNAGVEVAFDRQHYSRRATTFFTAGGAEIKIDINETLPLPKLGSDGLPLKDANGNIVPENRPNPNFGRPYLVSKREVDNEIVDRTAVRATAFYKLNLEEMSDGNDVLKWLGDHTFSLLADHYVNDFKDYGQTRRAFSDDFDLGAHISNNGAQYVSSGQRHPGFSVYLGPPVQSYINNAFDPSTPISLGDIKLESTPADIRQIEQEGYEIDMVYWNKGPDAETARPNRVGSRALINGNESWQVGSLEPRLIPNETVSLRHTEVKSFAVNAQSFFFDRNLAINTGYREDYIQSWLNSTAPVFGPDQVPSVDPEVFRWQDGTYSQIRQGPTGSGTFGYGAVLHIPDNIIKLPYNTRVSFHYNFSENFVPDASRRTIGEGGVVERLPAPTGESEDFGITLQMFDQKLIMRLNWYENVLIGGRSNVGNLFNRTIHARAFNWWAGANETRTELDSSDGTIDGEYDGQINQEFIDEERRGDETDEEVIAREWPNWEPMLAAFEDLSEWLGAPDPFPGGTSSGYWKIKEDANIIRLLPDGDIDDESFKNITDFEDAVAEGFEADIIFNPTRNWRLRLNVAQQQTTRSNIGPNITRAMNEDFLPWLSEWGHLDWNNPAEAVRGNDILDQSNDRLIEYFTNKAQEGRATDEVREWRANLVTNYTFREGFLEGFDIGGAIRWQDKVVIGYPLIPLEVGSGTFLVGDVNNPYYGEDQTSYDLWVGYSTRIFNDIRWDIQINFRNLENLDSDNLSVIVAQPDGSPARMRFDPPLRIELTSTFSW